MTNQLHHAQQKLKPLEWILGQWQGQGQAQGNIIYGVLHATLRLENSFLVINEAIFDANEQLIHEDCTWCYWQPDQQHLVAQQFMPIGLTEQRIISIKDSGMSWWAGPAAPVVNMAIVEALLQVRVIGPEQDCWSEIHYHRTQPPS